MVSSEDINTLIRSKRKLAALSTHQFCPPLPDPDVVPTIPLLLLRTPWARLRSVYEFDRQRGPVNPAAEIARMHDFPAYVDEMIRLNHPTVINTHVRQLSGGKRVKDQTGKRPDIETETELAWDFVKSLFYVGLVERFDDARVAWQREIRSYYPDFEFFDVHANRTIDKVVSPLTMKNILLKELGRKRVTAFDMANHADWRLYRRTARRCGVKLCT